MRLFQWVIGRSFLRQPLRTSATVLSLAVGVAVVVAIQLANTSSVRGFSAALNAIAGRTSLEITAPGVGLSENRLRTLGWLREFGLISPVIDVDVAVSTTANLTGDGFEAVRLLGVDILRDQPFRDYSLFEGETSRRVTTHEFLTLLTDPHAVVLTYSFTDRHGLKIGDQVTMLVGDRVAPLRIAAILGDDGPGRAFDGNFALMDIAAAQWAVDRLGFVDRLDILIADNLDVEAVEREVVLRLPNGLDVRRPSRRGVEVERMLRAFHFNLTALSFVALLVGLFLVYNTVSVSVIRRQPEIGMLRTIGVTRRTIMLLFLAEASVLGMLGSTVGIPLGWLLAQGAVGLTASTVSQFWVASAAQVPALTVEMIALAFSVGLPLALAAGVIPAREAARVLPVEALRRDAMIKSRERLPSRYIVVPVFLFAAAVWMARQDPIDGLPVFGLAAALAVVFGAALLMPAVLFGFWRMCGSLMTRWFNVEGKISHANLGSAIPRLSISVAALSVSFAMMVAIAIMVGSFRDTVVYWVGQTLQADLFVSTARASRTSNNGVISTETETLIASHPEVVAVDGFSSIDVRYGGELIVVGAGRFNILLEHGALHYKEPADGHRALASAIGSDAVVVTEAFSLKHRVRVNDTIRLPTPHGDVAFRVAAIYFDYSNDRGIVVMDVATFAKHFAPPRPAGLTVYLRSDSNADLVREELRALVGADRPLFITTNAALRREVLRIFDSTFAITYALEAIAIVVSMFGVAITLLTLVLERRNEIAMLRLVGADHRQLRRTIVIEAGVLGALTQVVGLVVGVALSLILIYVINVQSFGWTIQFRLPIVFLAQSSVAILCATAVAGLYPARLAANFSLGDVSRGYE